MDLFFSSILVFVALIVILGFVLGLIRDSQGECDADDAYKNMKPVAIVSMILISILTLFFVFKIITISAKYIQIKKRRKLKRVQLSSDEEDDKDQRILIRNSRRAQE